MKMSTSICNRMMLSASMCKDFHALWTGTIQLWWLFTENRPLGGWDALYISPLLSIQLFDCLSSTCWKSKRQAWWAWHGDQDGRSLRTTPTPTQHKGITHFVRLVTKGKQLKQTHLLSFTHTTFYSETPDLKMGCDTFLTDSTLGLAVYKPFKPAQWTQWCICIRQTVTEGGPAGFENFLKYYSIIIYYVGI